EILDLASPGRAGLFAGQAQPDLGLRPDAEPEPDAELGLGAVEDLERRGAELDHHLGRRDGHRLAGPDEDRDARPAPGREAEPYRNVCFDGRLRVDALDVVIALVLAAN